jgi:hypothetical protein
MKILCLIRGAVLAGATVCLLNACAVHLVSDYDEQIDTGLSQLNTDVTAFVDKMIESAGQPAGTYAANKDFYIAENAKIDTLIVRAEAHKALNSCPSSTVMAAAVKARLPVTPPPVGTPSPVLVLPDASSVLAQVKNDDCSVVLMSLIKTSFGQLEAFHKAQDPLGIPSAARDPLLVGGFGSLIHTAIVVQVALKSGKSAGGGNGS